MSKAFSEKGFKIFDMPLSEELTAYNLVFKKIYIDNEIKSGYELKSWHSGKSEMISPSFFDYDSKIMSFVFSSGLIKKIEKILGEPIIVINVTYTNSIPPGYFSYWHQDTFRIPVYKLFYYPSFNSEPKPRVQILENSIKAGRGGLLNRVINSKIRPWLMETKTLISSDTSFAFFSTYNIHRAVPVSSENGDPRIAYSICTQSDFFNQEKILPHPDYKKFANSSEEVCSKYLELYKKYNKF